MSPQEPPTSPGDSANFRKKRREVRCHASASANFSKRLGSREGGPSRKKGFAVGGSQRVHPSPETGGGEAQPGSHRTSSSGLRPTGRQTPPHSSGHLVAQAGLFMNPAPSSPRPALRPPSGWPQFRGWGKLGQPPSPLLPFLPPASAVDTRGGQVLFPVLLCLSCRGHFPFWEWKAGGGVTPSTLDSGGDSGLFVPGEETVSFLVKRGTLLFFSYNAKLPGRTPVTAWAQRSWVGVTGG